MINTAKNLFWHTCVPQNNVEEKDKLNTLPNLVTISGIFFSFLYGMEVFYHVSPIFAISTILLAGFSDSADGFLARKLDSHSRAGKLLDPLRDKILIIALVLSSFWVTNSLICLFLVILWGICEAALIIQELTSERSEAGTFSHTTEKVRIGTMLIFSIILYTANEFFISIVLLSLMVCICIVRHFIPFHS